MSHSRLKLTCSVMAIMFSQAAWAQNADEIIVTGIKFEKSLMDVTESVAVITGEEIAREPIADIYDVIERVPNVTEALGEQGFSIRGVDQRGIGGGGRGLTITTYVDDAPLGNQTTFFGPTGAWDVEQIEVFRGPQSTNFGRNALAGAIYIRTREPEFEWDLRLRAEAAQSGTYHISAAGGGPIIDDKLAFRLSGDYRESNGYITNTYLNEPADAATLKSLRGKLLFTPTDNLRISTTTSYTENFAGEDLVAIGADNKFNTEVAYDIPGREGTETFLNAVNATWTINELWSLQSITTLQQTDYTRIEDFDVTIADIAALNREGTDEALSQELRLKYEGERLRGLIGLYYVDTENSFTDDFTLPGSFVNPALAAIPTLFVGRDSYFGYSAKNYAIFADGEYDISDKFSLLFGARYDREKTSQGGYTDTRFIPGIPPGLPPAIDGLLRAAEGREESSSDSTFNAFLPKVGVKYAATDTTNISFVVQQGYRAGGSEISVIDGTVNTFDPEYLTNYEVSTRSSLMDGRLTLNTNFYYADWKDQQVAVPINPLTPRLTQTENAGKSTLMGFEASTNYKASENLDVYGSVGYSHTEFKQFELRDGDDVKDLAGNEFPFAPSFSFNVGFSKKHDFGIFYGLDASYRGEVFTTNENESFNALSGYTLVNGRLGYAFNDKYRVTLYARNLLDHEYIQYVNRIAAGESGTARNGDPRRIGIRLDADF